jgi:uncharacterized GH25 family protein
MRRTCGALVVALAAAAVAQGHALYIVAEGGDPAKAVVVFSDDLAPDARIKGVTWKRLAGLKLSAIDGAGQKSEVKWTQEKDHIKAAAPAGTVAIVGQVDYGVFGKEGAKPKFLKFYPKAVLTGGAADRPVAAGGLEVLAAKEAGKVRFRVVFNGKPVAGAKVSVILPEKKEHAAAATDEGGLTPGFAGVGRFGVTARHEEPKTGEANGQKYEAVAHTATLVVDVK